MSETFEKYRSIVVANHDYAAHALALELRKLSLSEQRNHFGGDPKVGYVYLFRKDELYPDLVYECVASASHKDAIVSTYKNCAALNDLASVLRTRAELIAACATKIGMPAESIGIDDEVRGRALGLEELSTGQLVDVLAERLGKTILRTDSYGQERPA